ncbi:hypothetical protein DRE_00838 [Drechslerella stenobrocha 248]|uniref:Uncharacterized protein n=1 Tax=Drechslerella stenobrocha 248 TaxID=1043628 RepID=W7HQK1_9PEZI|nr:hypothetical protein DRE_00838 [Drechslerella stenobrocha 248]
MLLPPLAITISSSCSFFSYCIARTAARQAAASPDTAETTSKDTIIICSTRDAFIRELLVELRISIDGIPAMEDADTPLTDAQELILSTPISAILTTDAISVVYCPSIHHLRAYLSSLSSRYSAAANPALDTAGIPPYLAIHSMISLHHLSAEWSSQGLSRTLSAAIDTAAAISHNLLFSVSADSRTFGIAAELPLINSRMMRNNTKLKGFYGGEGFEDEEDDGSGGAQRDLRFVGRVKDVVRRWCRIVDIDSLMEDVAHQDRSSQDVLV